MSHQADKATTAQVDQHIARQRHLGERAIGDHDKPRGWELAAVTTLLVFIGFGHFAGWW